MGFRHFVAGFSYLLFWLSIVSYQAKADSVENLRATLQATHHECTSLSGAQRNVLLRLTVSWTEIDSVGFCDHQQYPNATGPACGNDILFFVGSDHILLTPANDTTSSYPRIIAYPHRLMDRLVEHQGGVNWNRCLGDFDIDPPLGSVPPLQPGQTAVYERTVTVTGNVLISIPCGTWTIHYVVDAYPWDYFWATPGGWGAQGMQALLGSDGRNFFFYNWRPLSGEYTILDFVNDEPCIHLIDEVTASICGPSPIDAHVQIRFDGYIESDGSDGTDWLPSPGDSIGLKFSYTSSESGPINVRYTIADISMWAGHCMNAPWASPAPQHTGLSGDVPDPITGTQFDFDAWVGNPDQYDLKVYDLKSELDPMYADYLQLPDSVCFDSLSKSISTIVAEKEVPGPRAEDILWIVARDYGMDCSVTPTASAYEGKLAFMQPLVTEFGDSVYNVTVPRDNDEIDTISNGFANGDFMGDAWEEMHFPDSLGYDIREIQPFIDTSAAAAGYPVMDKDSIPRGREVNHRYWDGDYLTNWEEYRGFLVLSDSLDISPTVRIGGRIQKRRRCLCISDLIFRLR